MAATPACRAIATMRTTSAGTPADHHGPHPVARAGRHALRAIRWVAHRRPGLSLAPARRSLVPSSAMRRPPPSGGAPGRPGCAAGRAWCLGPGPRVRLAVYARASPRAAAAARPCAAGAIVAPRWSGAAGRAPGGRPFAPPPAECIKASGDAHIGVGVLRVRILALVCCNSCGHAYSYDGKTQCTTSRHHRAHLSPIHGQFR